METRLDNINGYNYCYNYRLLRPPANTMNYDLYLTGTTQLKNSLIIALFAIETRLYHLVLDTMSRCLLNLQLV